MSDMELLLEEYKIVVNVGEKYFDRMYATLNYTMLFYGAVLALAYSGSNNAPAELIFAYLLPIGTYIMGLFYTYNSYVLSRNGYAMVIIEDMIKERSEKEHENCSFLGWGILSKSPKYNGNYILAYGTSLAFFIFAPAFDLILAFREKQYQIIVEYTNEHLVNLAICLLPLVFYCIYICFVIKLIMNIFKLNSEVESVQLYVRYK